MPKVSVVIPTYNRVKFVTKAINSVLGQSFVDLEVIVVDDGSTDGTHEELSAYKGRITYFHQHNAGVSAARNAGIGVAIGEWIAFLDSDDEWGPEYLARQMEWASRVPGICMQVANCVFVDRYGSTRTYFEINGSIEKFGKLDYLLLERPFGFVVSHGPWQIGSTIIRRDTIREAGLFDATLTIAEDFDLMARVALQGPLGIMRETLATIYRRDEPSESLTKQAAKKPIQSRESNERIYEKLKTNEALQRDDRKILNTLLSRNRRAIGNLLLEAGNLADARESYRRALVLDPSPTAAVKYLLTYLPTRIALWTIEKNVWLRARRAQKSGLD